jgi:DHA1 family multidrug resistance protein-like MFS transporter
MIIGAAILPISLFWFAWTSSPHISWIPPALAIAPIGMSLLTIFLPVLTYIVDVRDLVFAPWLLRTSIINLANSVQVYMRYTNSALAADSFLRSTVAASFPLFATYMYSTVHLV